MYRRPKFLEVLIAIRQEMAREADYDVDLFVELARSGRGTGKPTKHSIAEPTQKPVIRRPSNRKRA